MPARGAGPDPGPRGDHHGGHDAAPFGHSTVRVRCPAGRIVRWVRLPAGIGAGDWLLLQLETPIEASIAAAALARKNGAKVVLNLAPYTDFDLGFLDHIDVLVVNETELAGVLSMLGAPALDKEASVGWLAERIGTTVVATLGSRGALAAIDGQTVSAPALPITPLDTVGAGDTFVGYLAAGLAEGLDLAGAMERAGVAAGLACLVNGAQPSIPDIGAVTARIAAAK